MNDATKPTFTDAELEASLRGLGAAELEQRLEFAPLLTGGTDPGTGDQTMENCCACKIPPRSPSGVVDSVLASGPTDATPGDQFWGTGPTDGNIWR